MSEKYKKTFRGYLIDNHSPDPPAVTLEHLNPEEFEKFFLEANLNDDIATEAGVDVEAYKAASADLRAAAEAHNAKIQDLNTRYEEAVAAESSDDEIAKLREEGKALNSTTLEAFKAIQDEYLKTDDVGVYIGHPNINSNVETLQGVVAGLEKKELYAEDEESGALDIAWQLNAAHDYGYYLFDKDAVDSIVEMYDGDKVSRDKSYWGTDKMVPVYYVGDTLAELVEDAEDEDADIDYDGALKVYQDTLKQALEDVKDYSAAEVKGMAKIADILE